MTKSLNKTLLNVKKSLFFVFISFIVFSCGPNNKESVINKHTISMVRNYMKQQEKAWNNGDLDGFMKHYWKSDSLQFIGKSGLNKGWQTTLDNYKTSYKSKEEMGTLKFTNKSMDILGEESIFVVGEWHLKRQDSLGDLQGMYSLIWQQKNGKWVIITDHSS